MQNGCHHVSRQTSDTTGEWWAHWEGQLPPARTTPPEEGRLGTAREGSRSCFICLTERPHTVRPAPLEVSIIFRRAAQSWGNEKKAQVWYSPVDFVEERRFEGKWGEDWAQTEQHTDLVGIKKGWPWSACILPGAEESLSEPIKE